MITTESNENIPERPIINIAGTKVALGPVHRAIQPLLLKWANDFEVSILSGDPLKPMTQEKLEGQYEHVSKDEQRTFIEFIIYEQATLRPIGMISLRHIDHRNGTATMGILIGEKDCWNKGFGTEATILILDYGFTVLGLHNIGLDTSSYNERAIRAYTHAGFRLVGRRRETQRWSNKWYDTIIMECLVTEFENPLKPVIELP